MRGVTAAFTAALAASHKVIVRVDVLTEGVVVETIDDVIDGTVTLDQGAAARGRADLTIVGNVPTSPSSLLAPYGNELQIWRGLRLPAGDELVSLGIFRIDDANVDDSGDQVTIEALDRSARITDARFEAPYQIAAGTNYADAIENTVRAVWPGVAVDLAATDLTTPLLLAQEGDDRWTFVQAMATALAWRLYFDGDGILVGRPTQSPGAGSPVATLAEGDGGVLLGAARQWNRQGAYNRVIATGENTGESVPARGVATDDNPDSPTYYYGQFGQVPRFYTSPFITTDEQAQSAAQSILVKELGTTQAISFGTIVNPALEPDDVVRITRARTGVDEDFILDSLTIPLTAEAAMVGRTRATVV